jgi:hypothetical protein
MATCCSRRTRADHSRNSASVKARRFDGLPSPRTPRSRTDMRPDDPESFPDGFEPMRVAVESGPRSRGKPGAPILEYCALQQGTSQSDAGWRVSIRTDRTPA